MLTLLTPIYGVRASRFAVAYLKTEELALEICVSISLPP